MQQAIEAEFDEPLADIILGLREQGNSWRTVAGALGIGPGTLVEWRRALGLKLEQHDNVFDPSSLPERTPTDWRARELGYEDATDAVLDMRLRQGLTVEQAAERLGVCADTISRYTPSDIRGSIYNRSEHWWEVRRAQVAVMHKNNTEWRATNDLMWRQIRGGMPCHAQDANAHAAATKSTSGNVGTPSAEPANATG